VRHQQRKYLLAAHREIVEQIGGLAFNEEQQTSVVWLLNFLFA
jgi:hypothetical protein